MAWKSSHQVTVAKSWLSTPCQYWWNMDQEAHKLCKLWPIVCTWEYYLFCLLVHFANNSKGIEKKSNCVLFRLQALERWLLWPLTYPVCSQLATGLNKSGIWNRSWKSSWEYHFDGCQVQTPVSTGMMVIGVSKWKWGCVAVLQYNEYRCATLGTKHLVFIVRHPSRY